jgi:ADP-ribose pyrophosphatase YjhB (NUDIX family)
VAVVRAAGGLLWRAGPTGPRLALVHRPRRDDWSLPKGKLAEGESWEKAALREVEEETGCRARITSFAGTTSNLERRPPKIVLYWHMALVKEGRLDAGDEVDEVRWLTPEQALSRLDYESDRRLVERAPEGGVARRTRGALAIDEVRADLLRHSIELDLSAEGASLWPALELLDEADDLAGAGDRGELRVLLRAARWLAVRSLDEPERARRVAALRTEARRVVQRRRLLSRRSRAPGDRARAPAPVGELDPIDLGTTEDAPADAGEDRPAGASGDASQLAFGFACQPGPGAPGEAAERVFPASVVAQGPPPSGPDGDAGAGVITTPGRRADPAGVRAPVRSVVGLGGVAVSASVALGLGLTAVFPALRSPLVLGGLAGLVVGAAVALAVVALALRHRRD